MGAFEQLVLFAILRRKNEAYGMEVREEIEKQTERTISYGAVYTALSRLERKGYVSHVLGEATPERGGRAKKYFSVTPVGRAELRATQAELLTMSRGVTLQEEPDREPI
jgi:PadR family transcriptional regulator PadR